MNSPRSSSRIARFLRAWVAPACCCVAAFLAGFVLFHPGRRKSAPLTDGSAPSFRRAAEQIEHEHLLENASPAERVRWLLEICRQPHGLARDHALYEAIQHMEPGDFLAAVADLPALGRELVAMESNVREGLIDAGMERWLAVDKDGALRWLAVSRGIIESGGIEVPFMGPGDLGAAYAVLAAREPEWMRGQIDKLGKKTQRDTALRVLMSAEVERHPKKAREWLETFRGSKDFGEAFSAYVTGLAASDPRAAMAMAQSEDAPGIRQGEGYLAGSVFTSAAERSPALAAELLRDFEPKMRQQMMLMGLYSVGHSATDPFDWFRNCTASDPELLDLGFEPQQTAEMMMRPLISRDPQRTLEWITTLPDAKQPALREGALASWSFYNPGAFLDWLATQPPQELPKQVTSISSLARDEPDRFAKWLAALPPGELRERSQLTLATELARQGRVADAFAQFPQSSASDTFAKQTRELAGMIGGRDATAGAQWVTTLPAGPAQTEAAHGLVGAWAAAAPQEAAQWIESLPKGGTRDAATGALAGVLAHADPTAAAAWLDQIGDLAARQTAAQKVFRSWSQADAASARAWLRDEPGVSDLVKSRLLRSRR